MDPDLLEMLEIGFKNTGLKLNMGKSCIRFKRLEDLDLVTIGTLISMVSVDDYIRRYEIPEKNSSPFPFLQFLN